MNRYPVVHIRLMHWIGYALQKVHEPRNMYCMQTAHSMSFPFLIVEVPNIHYHIT
ncbi:hypothetical protein PAHAL_8G091200 [Panicum hallii]|uniref:Uncharacterized protein n=1 Tax=Panicum hallii TaxID=206008 RepID=A0A2T8I8A0_9POAL|nr:hypothetical protein PAHAL_8G091200 [Panicum hallii]